MPLPTPRKNEKQSAFISRCISFVKGEDPDTPDEQVQAMCFSQWNENKDGGDAMSIKVYTKGKSFANSLIQDGQIDESSDWSFSAADGNKLLGEDEDDWTNFAKHHLAEDTEANEGTKARYKYPHSKLKGGNSTIYRRGVIAAKARAAQQGQDNIANAADDLLNSIDKKLEQDGVDLNKLNDALTQKERDAMKWKKKKQDAQYLCECIDCGHTMDSDEHCRDIQCPECGGQMRRKERPGPGNRDSMKGQSRSDFFDIMEMPEDYMNERFRMTEDGFLKGRAVVTNVGVFTYRNADGSVTRELRLPGEVFDPASMESLKMVPLTNDHPPVKVDTENVKELQVGHAGESLIADAYRVSLPLVVTDPEVISSIQDGKKAISCGYTVDLEDKTGVWMGVPYDAIQRNIRYNHIAVNIDRGRAGDDAVMKLDSVGAVSTDMNKSQISREDNMPNLKKVKLDGVEYEAEAKVIESLHSTQEKLKVKNDEFEALKTDKSKIEADRDSLKDENEQLKKDKEELEKAQPEKLEQAVKSRLSLLQNADKAGIEVKEDMKEEDIKKSIILKAFPKAKEKLDSEGVEDAYINARYDAAVEYLEDRQDTTDQNRQDVSDTPSNHDGNGHEKADSASAREKMIERMQKAYQGEKQ